MRDEQVNASALIESEHEDGKVHLVECDATAKDGKARPIWTPVWLQTKVDKKFASKPLLCDAFCAAKTRSGPRKIGVSQENSLYGTLQVDANEH